jgi:TetR/AcrR family transcriptional repressor of nem operon
MARRSMREEISVAALERFHATGFHAAGIKDITDAAGVPKGSFYNHYDSKDAMALEALRRYGAAPSRVDLADESVAPLIRLREHFEELRERQVDFGYTHGCLLGNFANEVADHNEAIRTHLGAAFDSWIDALARVISQGRRDGTITAALDPDMTARFLLGAWEGALILARSQRTPAAFDAFFATAFDVMLKPAAVSGGG